MPYVLVNPSDDIVQEAERIGDDVATKPGWRWLPLRDDGVPEYNPRTQAADGPFIDITDEEAVKRWVVRDMTDAEIRRAELSAINSQHHVIIKALNELDNKVRALGGESPLDLDAYKEQLRGLL